MRNVQTVDGKWQVLGADTAGYFFYYRQEKYYLADWNMHLVRRFETLDL